MSSERSAQVVLEAQLRSADQGADQRQLQEAARHQQGRALRGRLRRRRRRRAHRMRLSGCERPRRTSSRSTKKRDVELSAISVTGERMNFAVRTECDDANTTLRCVSDAPARAHMYGVPPGTYYLVLESSPSREVDFSLDVAFLPAVRAAAGQRLHAAGRLAARDRGRRHARESTRPGAGDLQLRRPRTDADQQLQQFRPDSVYRVKVDKAWTSA